MSAAAAIFFQGGRRSVSICVGVLLSVLFLLYLFSNSGERVLSPYERTLQAALQAVAVTRNSCKADLQRLEDVRTFTGSMLERSRTKTDSVLCGARVVRGTGPGESVSVCFRDEASGEFRFLDDLKVRSGVGSSTVPVEEVPYPCMFDENGAVDPSRLRYRLAHRSDRVLYTTASEKTPSEAVGRFAMCLQILADLSAYTCGD